MMAVTVFNGVASMFIGTRPLLSSSNISIVEVNRMVEMVMLDIGLLDELIKLVR